MPALLSWFQRESSSDVAALVAVALRRGPIGSERGFRGLVLVSDRNLFSLSLLSFAGGKIAPVSSSGSLCLSGLLREAMLVPVPVFDRLMFERAELPFSLLPRVNPRPKPELKDSVKAFSADRVEEARAYVSWT